MTEINEKRPKRLSEYLQHNHAVEFARNLISKNFYKEIRSLNITGPSGGGKSLLASLIARTTLCENREVGSSEACGECPVCLGEDTTNIEHYTITNSTEAAEHVDRLKSLACSMPVISNPRSDNNYRFIIIDEFELATAALAAKFLDPIEYTPATTVWIIISMDPKKLEKRDPIIKEAIDSRCVWLPLSRFTNDSVASNLVKHYPELEWDAAIAIAECSGGNMRKAWNELVFFRSLKSVEEITEEVVFDARFGGADHLSRSKMWKALEEQDASKVRGVLDFWKAKADEDSIMGLLQKDLIEGMSVANADAQRMLGAIGRWYSNPTYSIKVVILQFLGCKLIPKAKEEVKPTLSWGGGVSVDFAALIASKVEPKIEFFSMTSSEIFKYVACN